ncbi:MAG: hypothetical protein K5659_09830 [Lachnospiraceae bacterium]|nr:hypothetical protein [Lachnospiraceae bacterium]
MNKGLEIRNKKWEKQRIKRNTVKDEQVGLCRFIDFKVEVIEKVNGKYRHTGHELGKGLQIENKVYLLDGRYKFVNRKSLKIIKIYNEIPNWASDSMITDYSRYNKENI